MAAMHGATVEGAQQKTQDVATLREETRSAMPMCVPCRAHPPQAYLKEERARREKEAKDSNKETKVGGLMGRCMHACVRAGVVGGWVGGWVGGLLSSSRVQARWSVG